MLRILYAVAMLFPFVVLGEFPRQLSHEMYRLDVQCALVREAESVDEHIVWSPDGVQLGFNEGGHWKSIRMDEIFLYPSTWIGMNVGSGMTFCYSSLTQEEVAQFDAVTRYDPREIRTDRGHTVSLEMQGFATVLKVDGKEWGRTQTTNCHSLSLSPDQRYVAFIAEMSGIMVIDLEFEVMKAALPEHVQKMNAAINKMGANRWSAAMKDFENLANSNPDYKEAAYYQGIAQLFKEDFAKARTCFERLNPTYPDFDLGELLLGMICYQLDDYTAAAEHYHKFQALRPNDVTIHIRLGEVCLVIEDDECACSYFEKAVSLGDIGTIQTMKEFCSK